MDDLYNRLKEETTSGSIAYARGEMKQADATAKEFAKDHSGEMNKETEEQIKKKKALQEAVDNDVLSSKKGIIDALKKVISEQPLPSTREMVDNFRCSDLTPKNTLIRVLHADEDLSRLEKLLPNDLGALEIMEGAITDRTPLSKFATFRPFLYLYGARLVTAPYGRYGGKIVYIGAIGLGYVGKELLYVEDLGLVEAIQKNISDVKSISRNVYPRGSMFKPGVIKMIKELSTKE